MGPCDNAALPEIKPTRRGDMMRQIAALHVELYKAKSAGERETIQRQITEIKERMLAV